MAMAAATMSAVLTCGLASSCTISTVDREALLPVVTHLPKPRSLDDLFDELLEGTLHAFPCLGAGFDEHHLVLPGTLLSLLLADNAALLHVTLMSTKKR